MALENSLALPQIVLITSVEVFETLKPQKPGKALGQDGFNIPLC